MLKFSRSKELKMELADINELIKSLVFFLKNQAHDKVINFELDLHNIPQFAFDTELIENVLLNLSFNAIQSISAEGEVKYTSNLDVTGEFVVISVSDNGGGISPEVGEEIYKPFYTTRTKGTGLGLAISKDIIQKHRGELWYENIPGSGCAFFISIPK